MRTALVPFFTVFSGILCHNQDHSTAKYGMGIIFLSFFDLKNEASPTHFSYRKNKKILPHELCFGNTVLSNKNEVKWQIVLKEARLSLNGLQNIAFL